MIPSRSISISEMLTGKICVLEKMKYHDDLFYQTAVLSKKKCNHCKVFLSFKLSLPGIYVIKYYFYTEIYKNKETCFFQKNL